MRCRPSAGRRGLRHLLWIPVAAACLATGPCYCPPDPLPEKTCARPGTLVPGTPGTGELYAGRTLDPSFGLPSCAAGSRQADAWSFTPACDGWARLGPGEAYFPSVAFLESVCGDASTTLLCGEGVVEGLRQGTTYTVVFAATDLLQGLPPGYGSGWGYDLPFEFSCGEWPAPAPDNDRCEHATPVDPDADAPVAGTTRGAAAEFPPGAPLGPDVWFAFSLYGESSVRATLTPKTPGFQGTLALVEGACGDLANAVVLQADDGADGAWQVAADDLQPGTHRLVVSGAAHPAAGSGPFVLAVATGPRILPRAGRLVVNEVSWQAEAGGPDEFVELLGEPARRLDGITVEHLDGVHGDLAWSASLDGLETDGQGRVVLAPSAGRRAGAGGGMLSFPAGALAVYRDRGKPAETRLDAVGWGAVQGHVPAEAVEGEAAATLPPWPWQTSIGRYPDGTDTGDNRKDLVVGWIATRGAPNAKGGLDGLHEARASDAPGAAYPATLPDASSFPTELTLPTPADFPGDGVYGSVQVALRLETRSGSDLSIQLISPGGRTVTLVDRDLPDEGLETVFDLVRPPVSPGGMAVLAGEAVVPGGDWTLRIIDQTLSGDATKVVDWAVFAGFQPP